MKNNLRIKRVSTVPIRQQFMLLLTYSQLCNLKFQHPLKDYISDIEDLTSYFSLKDKLKDLAVNGHRLKIPYKLVKCKVFNAYDTGSRRMWERIAVSNNLELLKLYETEMFYTFRLLGEPDFLRSAIQEMFYGLRKNVNYA